MLSSTVEFVLFELVTAIAGEPEVAISTFRIVKPDELSTVTAVLVVLNSPPSPLPVSAALPIEQSRYALMLDTPQNVAAAKADFRKDPRITWVRYDDPQRVRKALAAVGR